jgi:hypothetical protein
LRTEYSRQNATHFIANLPDIPAKNRPLAMIDFIDVNRQVSANCGPLGCGRECQHLNGYQLVSLATGLDIHYL